MAPSTLVTSFLVVCVVASIANGFQHSRLPAAEHKYVKHHWSVLGPLPEDTRVELTVALKQQNIPKLEKLVASVSDPASSQYGHYWTVEQLSSLVAPPASHAEAVCAYWTSIGAERCDVTLSRDFAVVTVAAKHIQDELGARVMAFEHRRTGRVLHRTTDSVMLPADIMEKLDGITGLTDFPRPHVERLRTTPVDAKRAAAAAVHPLTHAVPTGTTLQAGSAPDLTRVAGSATDMTIDMTMYCANGKPTANPNAPCFDFPPAVDSVSVFLQARGQTSASVLQFSLSDLACKATQSQFSGGTEVTCTTPNIELSGPYARTNISAQTSYADQSVSAVGSYGTMYAPTGYILPDTIYKLYGVPRGIRSTHPSNSQAVTAFEKQYISLDGDLASFFDDVGMPFLEPEIHGANDPSSPGGESTLDIQYVMGVGAGVPTTFWSVSGPTHKGGYILEWAMQVGNASTAPLVTSISYGDTELGYFNAFGGWWYINRMNAELAKMAARGFTVIAGSGDAGTTNVGEMGNDLSPTDPTCTPFRPFFPSNSPYVMSLSASFLSPNHMPICAKQVSPQLPVRCGNTDDLGEVAVSVSEGLFWTTGGGFSNVTATPYWQARHVEQYERTTNLPPLQFYNSSGRGYPDVSTLGHNLLMVWRGQITSVGGTSASGPVMAGLVSLLNDARLNAGKGPLGLLNPLFYNVPEAFTDITVGSNADGDLQVRGSPYPSKCPYGFKTAPGWDPVSGLGSPNWRVLRDEVLKLQ